MVWDKKTWMSILIAVIMVASVIGFALEFRAPVNPPVTYGGYTFTSTNQGYQTVVQKIKVYFYNLPQQLEDIPFDDGAKTALSGTRVLWVTYDTNVEYAPEIADSLYYIEQALDQVSSVFVQRGLVNNTGYTLPVITCANATTTVPVLLMRSGNETTITHANGCITATAATRPQAYQLGDRLLYQSFKVMS